MASNPLTDIFPAHVRKVVYALYALVGLILGGVQVGFSAARVDQPVSLTVALAVFAFVGTATGLTAAANTAPATDPAASPAAGGPSPDRNRDPNEGV